MKSVREICGNGRKRNSLGDKIGLGGCTRSFRERNKWHLRGSIYRLIWISRTSDAFLPSLLPLVSWLFLSLSLFCSPFSVSVCPAFAIFIVLAASIHPVIPHKDCLWSSIVVGSSVVVFAQYFKRLLMEIAIMPSVLPPFRKSILSKGLILDSCGSSPRLHWPPTYPVGIQSLEI